MWLSAGVGIYSKPTTFQNSLTHPIIKRPSEIRSAKSICAIGSGLSHLQFFISSSVKANIVRFFSGRLTKGASGHLQAFAHIGSTKCTFARPKSLVAVISSIVSEFPLYLFEGGFKESRVNV